MVGHCENGKQMEGGMGRWMKSGMLRYAAVRYVAICCGAVWCEKRKKNERKRERKPGCIYVQD